MTTSEQATVSRSLLYVAMIVLLGAILFGAYRSSPPIYLAVGFICEIILVATVHLSSMIERYGIPKASHQ
ncbi:MAG: hypothetical protein ACYSUQ_14735 [Planctomycetota bacterium]